MQLPRLASSLQQMVLPAQIGHLGAEIEGQKNKRVVGSGNCNGAYKHRFRGCLVLQLGQGAVRHTYRRERSVLFLSPECDVRDSASATSLTD